MAAREHATEEVKDVRINVDHPLTIPRANSIRKIAVPVFPNVVRAEFVYADPKAHTDVALCGDWSNWEPLAMALEQGSLNASSPRVPVCFVRAQQSCWREGLTIRLVTLFCAHDGFLPVEGLWSVITIVPCGYREFCYIVDGELTISRRHPTTADGTRNWRNVHGPPALHCQASNRIMRFADSAADYLQALILTITNSELHRRTTSSNETYPHAGRRKSFAALKSRTELDLNASSSMMLSHRSPSKNVRFVEHPFRIVGLAIVIYASCVVVYRMRTVWP